MLKERASIFKSLPVSDWHQVIEFEKVVRNYLKMEKLIGLSRLNIEIDLIK